MADFQTRVDALTGLTVSTDYTTGELTEYLKDGVIEITNRIISLRPEGAEAFMRTTTSDSQGVDVGRAKIISVMREAGADGSSDGSTAWRDCRKVGTSLQSRLVDVESLNYASQYNPAYVLENNGAVNVYPVPSANNGIKVFYVNKTPVNGSGSSLIHSHDDILYFPEDKVYLVVLYAGIKALFRNLASKSAYALDITPEDLVLEIVNTSLPTYSGPVPFIAPSVPAAADVSFGTLTTLSEYIPPIFVAPTLATMETMTFPVSPVAPTMAEKSITLPTNQPEYIAPIFIAPEAPTFASLVLPVAPTGPDAPNFSTVTVDDVAVNMIGIPPTFTKPVVSGDGTELTGVSILDADNTIDTHADQIEFDQWWSTAAHLIEGEEDIDLATIQLQKIQTYLQAYQQQLAANQADFNQEAAEYASKLQEALKQSEINAQKAQGDSNLQSAKEQQEYGAKVNKFAQEVAKYSAEVNTALSQWTQEEYTVKFGEWNTKFVQGIQKYGADIQNELNKFNVTNVVYQAEVQESLQEATLKESKEGRDIQKYAQEIQSYVAEVNTEVSRWSSEIYGKTFNEWQQEYQGRLGEYQSNIQNKTTEIDSQVKSFQAQSTKALGEYQAESGYDVAKYQAEIQSAVNKFNSDLQQSTTDFANNLQKYAAEVQLVTSSNQNKIGDYSAKIQNATIRMQEYQLDYTWKEARLAKLQAEYDGAFIIMGGRPQQQQQQEIRRR